MVTFIIGDYVVLTRPRHGWVPFKGMEGIVERPHATISEAMHVRITKSTLPNAPVGHLLAVYCDQFENLGGPW